MSTRIRLTKLASLAEALDKIATEIEPEDPRIALVLDRVADRIMDEIHSENLSKPLKIFLRDMESKNIENFVLGIHFGYQKMVDDIHSISGGIYVHRPMEKIAPNILAFFKNYWSILKDEDLSESLYPILEKVKKELLQAIKNDISYVNGENKKTLFNQMGTLTKALKEEKRVPDQPKRPNDPGFDTIDF